jgi:hypothetical protein
MGPWPAIGPSGVRKVVYFAGPSRSCGLRSPCALRPRLTRTTATRTFNSTVAHASPDGSRPTEVAPPCRRRWRSLVLCSAHLRLGRPQLVVACRLRGGVGRLAIHISRYHADRQQTDSHRSGLRNIGAPSAYQDLGCLHAGWTVQSPQRCQSHKIKPGIPAWVV